MRRLFALIPLAALAVLAVFFWNGLGRDPREVPSVLINRPVPEFQLAGPPGQSSGLSSADLKGRVSLVSLFGSWCVSCLQEHPTLMMIRQGGELPIFGLDWRDDPVKGAEWLARNGNPYEKIGLDPAPGRVSIDFGVTGAPESFLVDRNGVIRYKQIGPITPEIWQHTLLPIVRELQK